MRISNQPEEVPEELPLEVQLWLSRGWTVIKTERRGIVLTGQKAMSGRSKFLIAAGVVLLALAFFPLPSILPWSGAVLLVLAVLDYKFVTKPPTKFFPADGEKKRTLER
jgi:hypothetical protein